MMNTLNLMKSLKGLHMKKAENKERLFYTAAGVISFLAVLIIIMICKNYFQSSDIKNISADTETYCETTVSEIAAPEKENSTPEKFFGVDVIEIG